jgi:hypothetical protein
VNCAGLDPRHQVRRPGRTHLAGEYEALRRTLLEEIARYETTYGYVSADVPEALSEGTLDETPEVAEWLVAIETLRLLERGREE